MKVKDRKSKVHSTSRGWEKALKKRGNKNIPTRTEKQKSKRSIIILDKDDHLLSEYGYFDVANKPKSERILSLHKLKILPKYSSGLNIVALIQGSLIESILVTSGQSAGLCIFNNLLFGNT